MAAVAVVGAGLAGLVAANHLKRRGIRVVVYEATDRTGGTIRSERRDEYLAELGPSALAAPSGAVADLITELALDGSRITAVDVVRYPAQDRRDQEINGYALPLLTQEAIAAQSADIDVVSGATFTSDGYTRSLQSALDKAGR